MFTRSLVFCLSLTIVGTGFTPALGSEKQIAVASTSSSAAELANQLAAAYGGMARIKEMLNRPTRGHVTLETKSSVSGSSNNLSCDILSKGNKIRTEMDLLGQKNISGYDGKIAWTQAADWVSRSSKRTTERLADELERGLNDMEKLDDPAYKLDLQASRQVNGSNCDVLKLTSPDGKWTLFYIDPVKRLVKRCEFMTLDPERGTQALKAVEYSDYRDLLGFPTPYKICEYLNGQKTQDITIDSLVIDDSIKDNAFQMPEESKISRLQQSPVTIPFEYLGNEIVITARINDGPDSKFIVDAGATQTVLDKSIAQSIGPTTSDSFSVTAGGKAVQLGFTKPFSLKLGDLYLENLTALVTDLSKFSSAIGQKPAGMIGANVLRRFLVTIDYQDKKIVFSDPQLVQVPDGAIVIPTCPVFSSSALVVTGILNDSSSVNFLVDTGAGFNNLPFSEASKLNMSSILPVGQIFGLDSGSTNTGSIKLKSLKIGSWTISNPVFALAPDKGDKDSSGLFAASAILGNPIWSKTKLNLDYRNDRIFVEVPADRVRLDSFLDQIETVDRSYLRDHNIDLCSASYERIMKQAETDGVKAAQALALARTSSLNADRFYSLKESRFLDQAAKDYERAAKLASESRNKTIEGQILASWAMLYLNAPRSNTDLVSSQNLLKKALAKAPMDATIYAALGSAMLKNGKSPLAIKFIDQALMLDPANWQALQEKYKILESDKKLSDMKLVLAQLSRYYPDFPQTKELLAKYQKLYNKPTSQTGSKGASTRNPKGK